MTENKPSVQYEQICKDRFTAIDNKLDKLDGGIEKIDEAIRGNGTIGLKGRIDRLEQADARRSRILWLIMSTTTGLAGHAIYQIFQGRISP
jgi:hypothetical protein